jgi:hypothetical protein
MTSRGRFKNSFGFMVITIAILSGVIKGQAQSSGFTYQGRLTDGGTAANGNYDFQFVLFDSLTNGTQIGPVLTLNTVAVTNGAFVVTLDFGASSFPGANRFLEIRARSAGGSGFTILEPRQPVTSTPYAVRSTSTASADIATNASQLGGIAASQYVQTNDTRLSDSRPPAPGSSSYIQNNSSQQSSTNFNISGNGTVGGSLSANGNLGVATSSFLRPPSLQFGPDINAAFIVSPGDVTPNAGYIRFGDQTGWKLHFARNRESSGGALNSGLAGELVTIVDKGNVGIGNTDPTFRLHVIDPSNTGLRVQTNTAGGTVASFGGNGEFQIDSNGVKGGRLIVKENGNVGIGIDPGSSFRLYVRGGDALVENNFTAQRIHFSSFPGLAQGSSTPLCVDNNLTVASCSSSSLRYKSNVNAFSGGLEIINRLRPISFTWKHDGMKDVGFGAEEVEKVAPLFTFRNNKGEIEGVRYDRLSVVFVNAFKEQQQQIESQQQLIKQQQAEAKQQQAEIAALNARLQTIERVLARRSSRPHRR